MSQAETVLTLIGKLNYTWTNTESLLIYLLAKLMGTTKETAIIVFLTLNTTRARLDLIERLAKMADTPPDIRSSVLAISGRMKQEARLRNKYNHCIYSFDENGDFESTQLLRIADFGEDLKYGKVEQIDGDELARIDTSISNVGSVNRSIWKFIQEHKVVV